VEGERNGFPCFVARLVHQLNVIGAGIDAGSREGVDLLGRVVVAGDLGTAGIGAVGPVKAVAGFAAALIDGDGRSGGCGLYDLRRGVCTVVGVDRDGQCGQVALGGAGFYQCGDPNSCCCRYCERDREHDRHRLELGAHTFFIFGCGALSDGVFLPVGKSICHVVRTSFLIVCT